MAHPSGRTFQQRWYTTMQHYVIRRFGKHLQALLPLVSRFLADLILEPEDGGDTVLRNVGLHRNFTAVTQKRRFVPKLRGDKSRSRQHYKRCLKRLYVCM